MRTGPEPELWERQRGEPTLWYDRFHAYCLLGAERSLLALYTAYRRRKREEEAREGPRGPAPRGPEEFAPPSSVPAAWKRRAREWAWEVRAGAFDDEQRRKRQAAWEVRQAELREDEWAKARRLMERVEALLATPLFEQEVERTETPDGKTVNVTVVRPAGWRLRDAATLLKVGSEVARRAAGMEKERLGFALGDLTKYTDEQLRRIRDGLDPGPPGLAGPGASPYEAPTDTAPPPTGPTTGG